MPKVMIVLMVLLMPVWALGQVKPLEEPSKALTPEGAVSLKGLQSPSSSLKGLLNPDRLSMSQSYTMSFLSSGKFSALNGLYLNTINYRFSAPVSLQVQFGYIHSLSGRFSTTGTSFSGGQFFIPKLEITYRPFKNMTITVGHEVLPPVYDPFRRYSDYYWDPLYIR